MLVLLITSVTIAVAVNLVSPKGIPFIENRDVPVDDSSSKTKDEIQDYIVELNDVEAAKMLFDSGKALFVDARPPAAYEEGHIRDAVSLPYTRFDKEIEKFINKYPLSTEIVVYCSGRNCKDSHKLAQLLYAAGFQNIKIFIGGYPAWKEKSYPSE
ncbi:MAG: rhodanese-like domain-containing protein [Deltaproteobacteria bacterium]|nr:rhodanese-like domain-containing protein [Deltaproteobacteria bacterium]